MISIDLSDLPVTEMPWGKHRGVAMSKVPGDYLRWLLREADHLDGRLRKAVETELERRKRALGPGGINYYRRGYVVHQSYGNDLPACGSLYTRKSGDSRSYYFPEHGRPCRKCFPEGDR
ncbi:MAG: DUF3820 family protein [Chloroflexota bacterium]